MPGDQEKQRRRLVYGRRQGHRLSARQKGLAENLLPQVRISLPQSGSHTGIFEPRGAFETVVEIWLEIGFGGGEHLAWQAGKNPQFGFIGCEPFLNGVVKLLSDIDEKQLGNIRIHDDDARDLLEQLEAGSIDRVFILFPDPWPKKRHHKRRFICQENLAMLARIMKPGAELRFASDIDDYVDWTLRHMRSSCHFEWTARGPASWRDRPIDWPATRYEAKAVRQGRVPVYLTFCRK